MSNPAILPDQLDATNSPSDNYIASYDLATGKFTWEVKDGIDGSGTATQVAVWSDTDTLAAGNLIPPANLLTLVAGAPYTLTIPATGTAGLHSYANDWTAQNRFGSAQQLTISTAGALNIITTGVSALIDVKRNENSSAQFSIANSLYIFSFVQNGSFSNSGSADFNLNQGQFLTVKNVAGVRFSAWDPGNQRFGIGTQTPLATLHAVNNSDQLGFVIKANATQTADVFQTQDSSAGVKVQITGTHVLKTVGRRLATVTKTTDYTLTANDEVVRFNKATAIIATLPPATGTGAVYRIKSVGVGACTVTADTSGTPDLIDGAATFVLYQYESVTLHDAAADTWDVL